MIKLKLKPTGVKNTNDNLKEDLKKRSKVIEEVVNNTPSVVQPEVKEKKIATQAKKLVYTSKGGMTAIFDSIKLAAMIFGVHPASVKNFIGKTRTRKRADDWLKGGRIDYVCDIDSQDHYTHKEKGHTYIIVKELKCKHPDTGEWYEAILYCQLESGESFVRSKESFNANFKRL